MPETLIGFGASSMEGVGDSQGGWFARAERIADEKKIRYRWINRGMGGDTTVEMLRRTSTVTTHKPYKLVVLLGCNDLPRASDGTPQRRVAIEQYRQNLDELFTRIKGTKSLFMTSFPACQKQVGIDPAIYEQYMQQASAAARQAGYDVWDLYSELKGNCEPFWSPDGLHFNDIGHAHVAQRFVEKCLT